MRFLQKEVGPARRVRLSPEFEHRCRLTMVWPELACRPRPRSQRACSVIMRTSGGAFSREKFSASSVQRLAHVRGAQTISLSHPSSLHQAFGDQTLVTFFHSEHAVLCTGLHNRRHLRNLVFSNQISNRRCGHHDLMTTNAPAALTFK